MKIVKILIKRSPVNSEVLADLKNIENPVNCLVNMYVWWLDDPIENWWKFEKKIFLFNYITFKYVHPTYSLKGIHLNYM